MRRYRARISGAFMDRVAELRGPSARRLQEAAGRGAPRTNADIGPAHVAEAPRYRG